MVAEVRRYPKFPASFRISTFAARCEHHKPRVGQQRILANSFHKTEGGCYVRTVFYSYAREDVENGDCIGFGAFLRHDQRLKCPSVKPTDPDRRREREFPKAPTFWDCRLLARMSRGAEAAPLKQTVSWQKLAVRGLEASDRGYAWKATKETAALIVMSLRRLKTPVTIGSLFGEWQVSWVGGWTRDRLVMLVRVITPDAK
jgi:hypothetical protein